MDRCNAKMFDKMCLLMAANALAAYHDHNELFDVYTGASVFQLGACMIQEGMHSQNATHSMLAYKN
jgi:hypothetical protein